MRIEARQATCIGAGQCVFTDPETFDQDDDGFVFVLKPNPETDGEIALARQAAHVCPSRSLTLVDQHS